MTIQTISKSSAFTIACDHQNYEDYNINDQNYLKIKIKL
jgi:hypothetical protein